jgi:type II secretion system protein G
MKALACALTVGLILVFAGSSYSQDRMLAHDVYFSLKDNSPPAKEKLIASCKKYLPDHPGVILFAVGPLADDLRRDVNDRDFDVALHFVFKSKTAYDQYATSERHLKFMAENQDNRKNVRVFDSYLEGFAIAKAEPLSRERMPLSSSPAISPARTGLAARIQANAAAQTQIRMLKQALEAYSRDVGEYPTTEQGLRALRAPPAGLAKREDWAGPYLIKDIPLDPWQRAFHYRNPGKHAAGEPDIWSLGPDGVDGTADDIGSWQKK